MNLSEIEKKITTAVVMTAKNAGKPLDDFGLDIYVECLMPLPLDRVLVCLRDGFKTGKLPTIQDIENFATARPNETDSVQEAVARICSSISRFGSPNSDRAREFIGELGWQIVERFGGWQLVCDVPDMQALNVLRAQMIKLGASVWNRAKLGIQSAPELPTPERYGLTSAGDLMKDMGITDLTRRV
jgi:hypothetical protein